MEFSFCCCCSLETLFFGAGVRTQGLGLIGKCCTWEPDLPPCALGAEHSFPLDEAITLLSL